MGGLLRDYMFRPAPGHHQVWANEKTLETTMYYFTVCEARASRSRCVDCNNMGGGVGAVGLVVVGYVSYGGGVCLG
jgi:hypothetical protein